MKIYIFADMEGCSGISNSEYIHGSKAAMGANFMAQDINACIAGCFDAGATEVIVRDGHAAGINVDPACIDPRATLIQGSTPGVRFPDIEGSDGLILLGYHAMAGTEGAVLEHTYSSKTVQNMWLNDRKVGEIGIDAAIAAEHHVPVIMVSGDDKACKEAVLWIKNVRACQVKTSYSTQGTRLIIPSAAHKLIQEMTADAVKGRRRVKPLKIDYPATLRREMMERCPVPTASNVTVIDGRTWERTGDSVEELLLK